MDYQEHPETQSRLKLSHVLLILAIGGLLLAIAFQDQSPTRRMRGRFA
jgi:hypothetical protein